MSHKKNNRLSIALVALLVWGGSSNVVLCFSWPDHTTIETADHTFNSPCIQEFAPSAQNRDEQCTDIPLSFSLEEQSYKTRNSLRASIEITGLSASYLNASILKIPTLNSSPNRTVLTSLRTVCLLI